MLDATKMRSTFELMLYLLSAITIIFSIVMWSMHVLAFINAKLKLNKRSYSSAASKRKTKFKHIISDKILPSSSSYKMISCSGTETNYRVESISESISHGDAAMSIPLPGVSIVKPLLGVDTNLGANLETFFKLDYPTYELLFCVHESSDPAVQIVNDLIAKYDSQANITQAKLFVGGKSVGVNPKINNMQPAYEASKYDLILISDSGISMRREALLDMVDHMRENVALVHQMPFVADNRDGFQAVIERVYFGTAHARVYLTADLVGINCATGMSALMRKALLDQVGGIQAFGQYLAEDFFFAKSFKDRGWRITISSMPALQNSGSNGAYTSLNSRIERWVKLRFAMVPMFTFIEPFSECIVLGLIGSLSIHYVLAFNPLVYFLIHFCVWFISDYSLLCTIQNGPMPFSNWSYLKAWLLRETTALYIFLRALTTSKVTWRSRKFKLKNGGIAIELKPSRI